MDNLYWIEDDSGKPMPALGPLAWSTWMVEHELERIVERNHIGPFTVSTVFLGLDHSFGGSSPILYETMVFGPSIQEYQRRYGTRAEAVLGHGDAVSMTRRLLWKVWFTRGGLAHLWKQTRLLCWGVWLTLTDRPR